MARTSYPIRQVRIDVPLLSGHAYFFVEREQGKWDPWWTTLYEFLLELAPPDQKWRHEPVQDVYVARPELDDEQRTALVALLRTAPVGEIEQHRTLRRAVELPDHRFGRIKVVYFSGGSASATSDDGRQ